MWEGGPGGGGTGGEGEVGSSTNRLTKANDESGYYFYRTNVE